MRQWKNDNGAVPSFCFYLIIISGSCLENNMEYNHCTLHSVLWQYLRRSKTKKNVQQRIIVIVTFYQYRCYYYKVQERKKVSADYYSVSTDVELYIRSRRTLDKVTLGCRPDEIRLVRGKKLMIEKLNAKSNCSFGP